MISVTEDEKAQIVAKADAEGVSISEFLRAAALSKPETNWRDRTDKLKSLIRSLCSELSRPNQDQHQVKFLLKALLNTIDGDR